MSQSFDSLFGIEPLDDIKFRVVLVSGTSMASVRTDRSNSISSASTSRSRSTRPSMEAHQDSTTWGIPALGMAMMGTGAATGENRAREAAEKAIRSPLLEDIDLHGARGILVNITAGPDLSIGEFNDVGATVQEFASQDATIVVGTAIDMEMSDELRVTVVAAGLDAQKEKAIPRETVAARPETTDYRKLQQPAVMRQQAARAEQEAAA